jgi:hypothetical protein
LIFDHLQKSFNGAYADIGLEETGFDVFEGGGVQAGSHQTTQ